VSKIKEIKVDKNKCVGAATCIIAAPKAFELNDRSIAVVKEDALKLSSEELLKAAQACPVKAITLVDEEGNQLYPKP
jgi:ferredoxin